VNKPAFLWGMIVILVVALLMAVRRDDSQFSGDTIVNLIAFGMMGALMGRYVIARMQGNATATLRDLTIWGVIIALVAVIYANKAAFGF